MPYTTFDINNRQDRIAVRELLHPYDSDDLRSSPVVSDLPDAPDSAELVRICQVMLDPDEYGRTRREIVRKIAAASPRGALREAVFAVALREAPEKDPGRVVGGLHKSLEATWRNLGGPGEFFKTQRKGFLMNPVVAHAVLAVLAETEPQQRDLP